MSSPMSSATVAPVAMSPPVATCAAAAMSPAAAANLQMLQPGHVIRSAQMSPCQQSPGQPQPQVVVAHLAQGRAITDRSMALKLPVRRRNVTFAEPPVEAPAESSAPRDCDYVVAATGGGLPSPSAASARSLDLERAGSTRNGQAYVSSRGMLTPTAAPSPGPYVALYLGTPRTPGMSPCSRTSGYGDGSVASQRHIALNVRETPSGSTPKIMGSPASAYDFWRYMAYSESPLVSSVQGGTGGTGLVAPAAPQLQPPSSPCRANVIAAPEAVAVLRPVQPMPTRRYV